MDWRGHAFLVLVDDDHVGDLTGLLALKFDFPELGWLVELGQHC